MILTYEFTIMLEHHKTEGKDFYEGRLIVEELVQAQSEYSDREVLSLEFQAKPGETFRHASTVGPPKEDLVVELALPAKPGEPAECAIEISRGKTKIAYLVTKVENGSTRVIKRDSPLQFGP